MTAQRHIPLLSSRHHLTAIAAAVVITGIGGCSAGSEAQRPSPTRPPQTGSATTSGQAAVSDTGTACNLVTAADASTTFGEPMTQTAASVADCVYASADQSQQLQLHEFVNDQTNMNNTIQQLESTSEHVTGLGDDAFWNGTIDTMFVRKGDRAFTIVSPSLGAKTPADRDAPKAAIVALATSALSKF
jgi:hypothetical protein